MAKDKNVKTGNGLVIKTDLSAVTQQIKKSMSDVSKEIKDSSDKTIAAIHAIPQEQTSTLPDKKLDAINVGIKSIRTNLQHTNRSLNYIAVKMNDQLTLMKAEAYAAFDRRDDFAKKTGEDTKTPNDVRKKEEEDDKKEKPKGIFSFLGDWIKNFFRTSFFAKMLAGLATFWGMIKVSMKAFAATKVGGIISGIASGMFKSVIKAIPIVSLVTGLFNGIGDALNTENVSKISGHKIVDWVDRYEVGFASFLDTLTLGIFGTQAIYDFNMKLAGYFSDWVDGISAAFTNFSFSNLGESLMNIAVSFTGSLGKYIKDWADNSTAVAGFKEAWDNFYKSQYNDELERIRVEKEKQIAHEKEVAKIREKQKKFFLKLFNSFINPKDQEMLKERWNTMVEFLGKMFTGFGNKAKKWLQDHGLWISPSNIGEGATYPSTKEVLSGVDVRGGVEGAYAEDPNYASKITRIVNSIGGEYSMKTPKDIEQIIKSKTKDMDEKQISDISNAIFSSAQKKGLDPTLLLGSTLLETGNFTNVKSGNYGGVTWNPSMGEEKKGHARPAEEGGYYVKFDSIQDSFDAQASAWSKHKVKTAPIKTTEAPTSTVKPMVASNPDLGNLSGELLRDSLNIPVTTIPQKPKTEAPTQKVQDKEDKIQKVSEKPKPMAEKETKQTNNNTFANSSINNAKSTTYVVNPLPLYAHAGVPVRNY